MTFGVAALVMLTHSGMVWAVPAPETTPRSADKAWAQVPLYFEPASVRPDEKPGFIARGHGYAIVATSSGLSVRLNRGAGRRTSTIDIKLVGANPHATLFPVDELPGRANYFIGADASRWRRDVRLHSRVELRDVYPGIDMVLYGNQRDLEYDFVVSPGADPSVIKLWVKGAKKLQIDDQGNLLLGTAAGDLVQRAPVVYQDINGTRLPVSGRYVAIGKNLFGFNLAEFDRTASLVIDPVLNYSTYLGGTLNDAGYAIAIDSAGNAYVTGQTLSSPFPSSGSGGVSGPSDAFVAKVGPQGNTLAYVTYLGGTNGEVGFGIALDSSGLAYVAGATTSTDFPLTASGFQPAKSGGTGSNDCFVAQLDTSGGLIYASYLGGGSQDWCTGIAVDGTGQAYVTGQTFSTGFPVTGSALQPTHGAGFNYDAFLSKFDPAVAGPTGLEYSTFLGGSASDFGRGVGLSFGAGGGPAVWVVGDTASANFPTTVGAFDTSHNGGADVFASWVWPVTGSLLYSTYLGGTGSDVTYAVAGRNSDATAYLTGQTNGGAPSFPVTGGAFDTTPNGGADAFFARLNPAGAGAGDLLYSTLLGGNASDSGRAIAVRDSDGAAYVAGETVSTVGFPVTTNALQTQLKGSNDVFGAKFDSAGALSWATYLGGASADVATGVAIDGSGNAFISGYTSSSAWPTNVPVRGNPVQATLAGGVDGFVARLTDVNPAIAVGGIPASVVAGSAQSIYWTHNLGKYSFVKIEVSSNGAAGPWTVIPGGASVSNQSNATSGYFVASRFPWTVNIPPTTTGRIRVTWTSNMSVSAQSIDFTVVAP